MKLEEFKPFAEEWESMIMRMTKIEIIREILKSALIKNKDLIEQNNNFKLIFYTKLLAKLRNIKAGNQSLMCYINEIKDKIKKLKTNKS
ncbi:MAG: hypothetical protein IID16_00885 [Candidatus Marinimicrobia bacterium]|nr:hypothetical protein [Candidatus Neomarinimicrobiota bacterium]